MNNPYLQRTPGKNLQNHHKNDQLLALCRAMNKSFDMNVDMNRLSVLDSANLNGLLQQMIRQCGVTWNHSEITADQQLYSERNRTLLNEFLFKLYLYKKLTGLIVCEEDGRALLDRCKQFSLLFLPSNLSAARCSEIHLLLEYICDLRQEQHQVNSILSNFLQQEHVRCVNIERKQHHLLEKERIRRNITQINKDKENLIAFEAIVDSRKINVNAKCDQIRFIVDQYSQIIPRLCINSYEKFLFVPN